MGHQETGINIKIVSNTPLLPLEATKPDMPGL